MKFFIADNGEIIRIDEILTIEKYSDEEVNWKVDFIKRGGGCSQSVIISNRRKEELVSHITKLSQS